MTCKY